MRRRSWLVRLAVVTVVVAVGLAAPPASMAQAGSAPELRAATQRGLVAICYRAYMQDRWQSWVCNGKVAGAPGAGREMRALQVFAIGATGSLCGAYVLSGEGVTDGVCADAFGILTLGRVDSGRYLGLVAFGFRPATQLCANGYVDGVGWQGERCGDGVGAGDITGEHRVEAIRIHL